MISVNYKQFLKNKIADIKECITISEETLRQVFPPMPLTNPTTTPTATTTTTTTTASQTVTTTLKVVSSTTTTTTTTTTQTQQETLTTSYRLYPPRNLGILQKRATDVFNTSSHIHLSFLDPYPTLEIIRNICSDILLKTSLQGPGSKTRTGKNKTSTPAWTQFFAARLKNKSFALQNAFLELQRILRSYVKTIQNQIPPLCFVRPAYSSFASASAFAD